MYVCVCMYESVNDFGFSDMSSHILSPRAYLARRQRSEIAVHNACTSPAQHLYLLSWFWAGTRNAKPLGDS